jgi:manganese/zinc/iron transport system permease protein
VLDFWSDYTLRTVAAGAGALGAAAGALGTFAVLRRQSLLGDSIAHAALPGVVLAFILTGSRDILVLVAGAAVAGWIGALCVQAITRGSQIPEDGALGIVLSVFFGIGLVLLTWVQRLPGAAPAGLDRFLFGQAATLMARDVTVIVSVGGVAVIGLLLFWKEIKLLSFDRAFGASLGIPMGRVELLLTTLLVLSIVVGLHAVGVVLMSTLVVAPAVAARQWTDHLGRTVVLAALFGALAGVVGALLSASVAGLPTGPTIVVVASGLVLTSMLLAPGRGIVPQQLRSVRNRSRLRAEAVLADLAALDRQHDAADERAHPQPVLEAMRGGAPGVARALRRLEAGGLAAREGGTGWRITTEGREHARNFEEGR